MTFAVAKTSDSQLRAGSQARAKALLGLLYAWSGLAIMWCFWISFAIFLAQPSKLATDWPLPTVDHRGTVIPPAAAGLIDTALIGLFALQHSVMARPWFKQWWAASIPTAFERCTYVHMANVALFSLLVFWQPIPTEIWVVPNGILRHICWVAFAMGWLVLFAGAWSFGIRDLLGIDQMHRWCRGLHPREPVLKTGVLYRWLRHPMYVGVLLAVWATPTMTLGHALLALGFTAYVLLALRWEERDLFHRFGRAYERWRLEGAHPRRGLHRRA